MRTVLTASAIYAAVAAVISLGHFVVVPRVDSLAPWFNMLWVAVSFVSFPVAAILVSRWVVRASRRRGIVLPLLAWWLSSSVTTLIMAAVVLPVDAAEILGRVMSSITFRAVVFDASAPIRLFTVGDVSVGLAIPWSAVLICLSALWAGRDELIADNGVRSTVE